LFLVCGVHAKLGGFAERVCIAFFLLVQAIRIKRWIDGNVLWARVARFGMGADEEMTFVPAEFSSGVLVYEAMHFRAASACCVKRQAIFGIYDCGIVKPP